MAAIDKINIPKAGIYEVIGIFKRPKFDHRFWLMSTSPSDAGGECPFPIWDEVVLCSSGGQLWGKIMGLDSHMTGPRRIPNPVPTFGTLEETPQQVWCYKEFTPLILSPQRGKEKL